MTRTAAPPRGYPETSVFFRSLVSRFPLAVRAEGCWVYDADGTAYLDGCGGAFVVNVGHGVAEIADAMAEQARKLAYVSGLAFANEATEALCALLAELAPGDLDRVYPLSSGSDAVEAALKLARQYWVERGAWEKRRIVALDPAYHGNTTLALSASSRPGARRHFEPWMVDVVRVPAPNAYRCGCGGTPPYCAACNGEALEEAIERQGAETVAAFIAEPVGGSSTGAAVPPPGYLHRVREICDRHEVLFIADEILVGAGRTGTWSAMGPSGVVPDVMVMGKGIAGGYAPLSAVLAPRRITDVLAHGWGALSHAQTFSHHPVLSAAGVATIKFILAHGLIDRCAAMGNVLHRELGVLRELPYVGDIRGRGLLAGIELVANAATREPFAGGERVGERVARAARDAGLLVWPHGDILMLAPPFVITEEEIAELVRRLRTALGVIGSRS